MTPRDAALGEPFELRLEPQGQLWSLVLLGAFGLECVDQFKRELGELLERSPSRVIVDVSELTFVDSAGLGAFLAAERQAGEKNVELVLAGPSGQVRRALDLGGLDLKVIDSHS
jgi:anti-sigma B factor antagonist